MTPKQKACHRWINRTINRDPETTMDKAFYAGWNAAMRSKSHQNWTKKLLAKKASRLTLDS